MKLIPADESMLESWRKQYLNCLNYAVIPDIYEGLYQLGRAFLINDHDRIMGYVIVNEDNDLDLPTPVITELFLDIKPYRQIREVVEELIDMIKPVSILARTDETVIFPMLMDMHMPNQVASSLYYIDKMPYWSKEERLDISLSSMEEAEALLPIYASVEPIDGGIPDGHSLIKSLAAWPHYKLMMDHEAIGVCYTVPQDEKHSTIVPIIRKDMRGQGYGKYISAFVVNEAMKKQQRIIFQSLADKDESKYLIESLGGCLAGHGLIFKPTVFID